MKTNARNYSLFQRLGALCLALLMVFTILPTGTRAAGTYTGVAGKVDKVSDPGTIRRHEDVYGNDTENAGKVTVGKSVSKDAVTIEYGNTSQIFTPAEDNFVVTASQTAQIMGLASESAAPVDVVLVLDTSKSMEDNVNALVSAANTAINSLLAANDNNRVGVVAFSGIQGGGTSDGAAANMLSPLAHYDGAAQSNHLTLVETGSGKDKTTLLTGRSASGVAAGTRLPTSSGTNIHAGIACGANMLLNATNTTVDGVTRIPFLVVMSDGQPSYALDSTNWYAPVLTQQTDNLANVSGVGFLPTLTAAYYKTQISKHYFGDTADDENRCFIYTMGLGFDDLDSNNKQLALMTMDPASQTSSNNQFSTFESYWRSYQAGNSFGIHIGNSGYGWDTTPVYYQITKNTIDATKSSISTYKYNDEYFSASQGSDLAEAFDNVVTTIQKQALSSPTHVDISHGADFSGYVTYTDPIGEYMEVKQVYGLLADGVFYRGQSFAENISNWNSAPQEFKDLMLKVLQKRCNVTGATMDAAAAEAFMQACAASENQANYTSSTDFDNSIVWWGKSFLAEGEEDVQVQWLAPADNDTVEYITDPATVIPTGADYVCRSYYFYGEAGGAVEDPDHDYLYFVVSVRRSLTAPYQQQMVVSAPASLLSVEKVLITEEADGTYTAAVTEAEPARLVYEVGLRSDINAFNVDKIVGQDIGYVQETTVNGENQTVHTNYNEETGEYSFYTNDWDRSQSEASHHRAQTHVTFDAAANNAFYSYTVDTPIYEQNSAGQYVLCTDATKPVGPGYYYARTVYDWSADTTPAQGNVYDAIVRTEYIPITLPVTDNIVKSGEKWIIKAGAFKASSLTGGETIEKSSNNTDTSTVISHPHRTEDEFNSHYTVLLGNNGKLTLTSETTKKVDITKADNSVITDADGKTVMVGDILTYTIKVVNPDTSVATATVTDTIPKGTVYVDGSANHGGTYDDNTGVITWKNLSVAARSAVEVQFQVQVTDAVLSGEQDIVTIDNTAHIQLNNGFEYETNTTKNPPEGKKVVDTDGDAFEGNVQVNDVLTYRIRWQNDAGADATVVITDKIPEGTTYIADSASHAAHAKFANNTLTWTFENVPAGASGVVSFRVNVNAGVQKDEAGNAYVENSATITVNDDPEVTNIPKVNVNVGNLELSKEVANIADYDRNIWIDEQSPKTFTLDLYEIGENLNGTYKVTREMVGGTTLSDSAVTFRNGKASLEIMHHEIATIQGIPAGAVIVVTEQETGYTASYTVNDANASSATEGRVTIPANADASVAVSNTYAPAAVTVVINGSKTLESAVPLESQTFGFVAQRYGYNAQNQFVLTTDDAATNTVTGEVTFAENATGTLSFAFSSITITKAGTYYYVIKEINGGVNGITYDDAQYRLTVAVKDNGSGELTIDSSSLTKFDGTDYTKPVNNQVAAFVNAYEPQQTQLSLMGTKTLTGRNINNREFSFAVKEGSNIVATGYNTDIDNDGKYDEIVFSPIVYRAEDMDGQNTKTFTYTVTEDLGNAYGVVYDPASHSVEVTVTNVDGKLKAWISKVDGTVIAEDAAYSLAFENTFTPDDVSVELTGIKTVRDQNGQKLAIADQEFAFLVEEEIAANTWKPITTGNSSAATAGNSANIVFSEIFYDLDSLNGETSKVFRYRITEIEPVGPAKDPNMDYDDAQFFVTFTLSQDNNGDLQVSTPVYTKGTDTTATAVAFVNTQYPNTISVKPQAFKSTYKGNSGTDTSGVPDTNFSFVITDLSGDQVSVGVGSANHSGTPNVSFDEIVFDNEDAGKTFTYIIKEAHTGTSHGITHDATQYAMVVTIGRTAEGELTKNVKYFSYDPASQAIGNSELSLTDLVFVNRYNASGYLQITATKRLTKDGNDIAFDGKTFAFQMQRVTSITGETLFQGDSGIIEGISADGNVTFGTLYYDEYAVAHGETALRYYKITETKTDSTAYPGVVYDTSKYIIEVTLTHEPQGHIEATVSKIYRNGVDLGSTDLSNIVFINKYTPAGTFAEMEATKVLNGRGIREGEFRFGLYYVDAAGEHLVDTAYNTDRDGDGVYDDIYFYRTYAPSTSTGTYNYVIRELEGNLGGVTYDKDTVGKVAVTITDDTTNATLKSAVSYAENANNQIVFTNSYRPKETKLDLEGIKDLRNRAAAEGEFAFDVQMNGRSVATGYNTDLDNDGVFDEIRFTDITFSPADMWDEASKTYLREKIFTLTISEVAGNAQRMQYSTQKYQLTVKVTASNGELSAAITGWAAYDVDKDQYVPITDTTKQKLEFVNIYTPRAASVQLQATKTLNGRDMAAGEFSFVVREGIDNPTGAIKATGSNEAAADGVSAKVNFSNIGYALSDMNGKSSQVFEYTIYEEVTGQGGVTFSPAKYAKVTVTYNSTSGEIKVTDVAYFVKESGALKEISTAPAFVNTYAPQKISVPILVDKTLINKQLEINEFLFTLWDNRDQVVSASPNGPDGSLVFELTFEKPGTYVYKVTEAVNTNVGFVEDRYTMDNAVAVIITVTDDKNGKLHASVAYEDIVNSNGSADPSVGGVEFINYYTPGPLTADLNVAIGATKTMNTPDGVTYSPAGFKFEVYDNTGNVVVNNAGEKIVGVSDATGKISFPDFYFPTAGEYHYWIKEAATDKEGVQIDESAWEVHILVRYNQETGLLTIANEDVKTYPRSRATEEDITPNFTNIYDPAGTSVHLTAKKVLNGRALKDREFVFYLMEGNLIVAEGFNDIEGNIRFTVNYDAEDIGTHTYSVVEVQGSAPGVIYDANTYQTVTVTVKDDGKGQLVAYVGGRAIADGATVSTGAVFTNLYSAKDGVAVVRANKVLTGKSLEAEEFTFHLVNTADEKNYYTATNDANGNIIFQIAFDKAGTNTYALREVKGTDAHVTYDEAVYKVTIAVTDDGMGNLPVEVTYDTTDGQPPVFRNTYTPDPVSVNLTGSKTLTGRDMVAEEFTFQVHDASGALVAYATNDAKGVLNFTEIKFTTSGKYTLTVSEAAGKAENMTYDASKLEVVVEITNEDGVLKAEVNYPEGGLKFVNTYEAPPTPTEPEPTKPSNPAVPDTGDHSNVTLYVVLAVVSLGACLVLILLVQKNKKRK